MAPAGRSRTVVTGIVDVRGKTNAVAHRDHHVAIDDDAGIVPARSSGNVGGVDQAAPPVTRVAT
jgi:hypothetical protein